MFILVRENDTRIYDIEPVTFPVNPAFMWVEVDVDFTEREHLAEWDGTQVVFREPEPEPELDAMGVGNTPNETIPVATMGSEPTEQTEPTV